MAKANEQQGRESADTAPAAAGQTRVGTVRYVRGRHFTAREFSTSDWKRAGVEGGKSVSMNPGNNHTIPASEFDFLTDEQFEKFVMGDEGLKYDAEGKA
jgi:hypothetical protein